jgi:ankyrin repeat protein
LLTREDVDPNTIEEKSLTPLSLAARSGHEEAVKLLLRKHGVCVNSNRHGNRTPLSWAIEGHVRVVKILLSRRMKADAIAKDTEHSYSTMEWAIFSVDGAAIMVLLHQ